MGRNAGRVVAAAIVVGLFATACGSDGGSSSGGTYGAAAGDPSSPSVAGSSTSGGGRYGYGSGSGSGSTSGGTASVLTLRQIDLRFSPGKISLQQGDTITVSDTSAATPHTFTVEGTSIDVSNQPGQSQDVTIGLEPGTYPFYCRFHRSAGMVGTLVVK